MIYNPFAAYFIVVYDLGCLTDCRQSASEHSSESLQQEHADQEDGGVTSPKEEDKSNFMDFSVREVAEQLTRLDAVGSINKYLKAPFCFTVCLSFILYPTVFVSPSGAVCQSGALPLPGLRLVPA